LLLLLLLLLDSPAMLIALQRCFLQRRCRDCWWQLLQPYYELQQLHHLRSVALLLLQVGRNARRA
jgi:hypothetical protein